MDMDLDKYVRQVRQGKQGDVLQKLTESETGARLAAKVDGAKLEAAARNGDTKALSAMLQDILSTPEGKSFAQAVQRAVKNDGR